MNEVSAIELFFQAGIVVKSVMIILILASILSWIIIFERYIFFRKANENRFIFEDKFWSGTDLNNLYDELEELDIDLIGSTSVFKNSFKEFKRISNKGSLSDMDLEGLNRSMRVSIARDEEDMNKNLSILANIGSVSPYVGLFGTVWGIMGSFQGLSDATQATINAVAPGISEALIATAMGLFAAIPAVIAFNRFTSKQILFFKQPQFLLKSLQVSSTENQ